MPWIELPLNPSREWNEEVLADWAEALGAFLTERGKEIKTSLQHLPGYQIVTMGEGEEAGELLISSSERLITVLIRPGTSASIGVESAFNMMMGLAVQNFAESEFVEMLMRFARQMGARALRVPIENLAEKEYWQSYGAHVVPEPVLLEEEIQREKVGVEPLFNRSLLVTYKNKPALCLEPIFCTARPKGLVSLAARRLEKLLGGGQPIGFASRISAYSPWEFERRKWDDLLAYSRLEAYEVLESLILQSLPIEYSAYK